MDLLASTHPERVGECHCGWIVYLVRRPRVKIVQPSVCFVLLFYNIITEISGTVVQRRVWPRLIILLAWQHGLLRAMGTK